MPGNENYLCMNVSANFLRKWMRKNDRELFAKISWGIHGDFDLINNNRRNEYISTPAIGIIWPINQVEILINFKIKCSTSAQTSRQNGLTRQIKNGANYWRSKNTIKSNFIKLKFWKWNYENICSKYNKNSKKTRKHFLIFYFLENIHATKNIKKNYHIINSIAWQKLSIKSKIWMISGVSFTS